MTWYTGHYGNWNEPHGVQRIYFNGNIVANGTYNRKIMFEEAQRVANEKRVTVTVIASTGSPKGLIEKCYKVEPQTN